MKIILHSGTFHADDLVATSLLKSCLEITDLKIIRTNDVDPRDLENDNVFVIDVGNVYDPQKLNFDHHQDPSSPASCILIADWLLEQKKMTLITRQLLRPLLQYISDVDTGKIANGGYNFGLNAIIKSFNDFNNPNAFQEALNVVDLIIKQQLRISKELEESETRWKALIKISPYVVLSEGKPFLGWKNLAKKNGVRFLICKSDRNNGWTIMSVDTKYYPIPEDIRQTYLHPAKFLASYQTKKDAIDHSIEMYENSLVA